MCAMCHKSRKEDGRITVEMAFLLPLILVWIVWLVFFLLFLFDMSVLKSEVIRLSDEASMLKDREGELDTGRYDLIEIKNRSGILQAGSGSRGLADAVSVRLEKRLKERLMLTECKKIKVNVKGRKISVQGTLEFRGPFSGSMVPGAHGLQFTGRAESPLSNWEQWLWKISSAEDIRNTR